MATMKDIARIAQVSTSTVSHVINGTRFVSDEMREKIMAVVRELNYQPSALARSFKLKKTQTIGMLVTASNNPFFAEVVAVRNVISEEVQQGYENNSQTNASIHRLMANVAQSVGALAGIYGGDSQRRRGGFQ